MLPIAIASLIAAVIFASVILLPLPVWASRALRAKRQLALPPGAAELPIEGSNLSGDLKDLLRQSRITRAALVDPIEASDDYLAMTPYAKWLGGRGPGSENWTTEVRQAYELAMANADKLVWEWVRGARGLSDEDAIRLAEVGITADSIATLHRPPLAERPSTADDLARVDRPPAVADVERKKQRFESIIEQLEMLERALLATSVDPYR